MKSSLYNEAAKKLEGGLSEVPSPFIWAVKTLNEVEGQDPEARFEISFEINLSGLWGKGKILSPSNIIEEEGLEHSVEILLEAAYIKSAQFLVAASSKI